ncbi:hypothetical protein ABK040_010670 [Willaertia magna]
MKGYQSGLKQRKNNNSVDTQHDAAAILDDHNNKEVTKSKENEKKQVDFCHDHVIVHDKKVFPKEKIFHSIANLHSIPVYMYEQFVLSGYRMNLSFLDSFLSVFQFHNESINIWTAFLSSAWFIYYTIDILFFWKDNDRSNYISSDNGENNIGYQTFFNNYLQERTIEKIVFVLYCLSAISAFTSSMIYHWFNCISEEMHTLLLRIDISSIGLLVGGSYFPPLYYSYYCHPSYGSFYMLTIAILSLSCVTIFVFPRFSTESYRSFRVAVFGFTAAFGLCPLIHIIILYGLNNEQLNGSLLGIFMMYLFYAVGVFFYSSKFPERLCPGRFDLCCTSHQFWHVFVLLATLCHYYNCIYMKTQTDRCYGVDFNS